MKPHQPRAQFGPVLGEFVGCDAGQSPLRALLLHAPRDRASCQRRLRDPSVLRACADAPDVQAHGGGTDTSSVSEKPS